MRLDIEELIEFSTKRPWQPQYPAQLVRRFLTDLISSSQMISDIHDTKGRVATAVLLDKVNNPANDACLEILGMRTGAEVEDLIFRFVEFAKERTPLHRSGFQVGIRAEFVKAIEVLVRQGLKNYYDTYKMRRIDLTGLRSHVIPEIEKAQAVDRDQVYRVLRESFAQNPDTSIPDIESWGFLQSAKSHVYIWRKQGKIVAYADLVEGEVSDECEIRTIGVLPQYRGEGIGQALLNYCLSETLRLGFKSCQLTVAVTNQNALELYLRSGFIAVEKYHCFRMDVR